MISVLRVDTQGEVSTVKLPSDRNPKRFTDALGCREFEGFTLTDRLVVLVDAERSLNGAVLNMTATQMLSYYGELEEDMLGPVLFAGFDTDHYTSLDDITRSHLMNLAKGHS